MAGILKTQREIERAREQAAELQRKTKEINRAIREGSGRLAALAERLCGRTVLHLLRQGTPLSAEAIVSQARAIAGTRDQDALALLIEQLESVPLQSEGAGGLALDPTTRFALGQSLRDTPRVEPVDYVQADISAMSRGTNFAAEPPESHQAHLLTIIDAEGPICREVIHSRIRQLWSLPQAHPSVKRIIDKHVDTLKASGHIHGDGESFWAISCDVSPRRRSKGFRERYSSETVPTIEVRAVIVQCLLRAEGTMAEIVAGVCEMIGYESASHALRTRIQEETTKILCSRGDVVVMRD